jgi:hypothetical protein
MQNVNSTTSGYVVVGSGLSSSQRKPKTSLPLPGYFSSRISHVAADKHPATHRPPGQAPADSKPPTLGQGSSGRDESTADGRPPDPWRFPV